MQPNTTRMAIILLLRRGWRIQIFLDRVRIRAQIFFVILSEQETKKNRSLLSLKRRTKMAYLA